MKTTLKLGEIFFIAQKGLLCIQKDYVEFQDKGKRQKQQINDMQKLKRLRKKKLNGKENA